MKVLIYGGGAVGLGLASCLIQSEETVDIITREPAVKILRSRGLIRSGMFGDLQLSPDRFSAYATPADIRTEDPYDFILVCTKSYDSETVATDLAAAPHCLHPRTCVILCQNGWGNAEVFARRFDESRIFNARVITGFSRPEPNHVDITVHVDAVHMGSVFEAAPDVLRELCTAISQGGLPCETTDQITRDIWAKMLYNCALNPLGAIFGVPYGKLGKSDYTRQIMEQIIREIFAVLGQTPYRTSWSTAGEYIEIFFNSLIPATAKHEASTLQDIRAKKRTEIDALNGAVVKLGKKHGVDVSTNTLIYKMIKFKEAQYLSE